MKRKVVNNWFIHGWKFSREYLEKSSKVAYTFNPEFIIASTTSDVCDISLEDGWKKRTAVIAVPFSKLSTPWKKLLRHISTTSTLQKVLDYVTIQLCNYFYKAGFESVNPKSLVLEQEYYEYIQELMVKFGVTDSHLQQAVEAIANLISVGMDIRKKIYSSKGMIPPKTIEIDTLYIHLICENKKSKILICEENNLPQTFGRYAIVQPVSSTPELVTLTLLLEKLGKIGYKDMYLSMLESCIHNFIYMTPNFTELAHVNVNRKRVEMELQSHLDWPKLSPIFEETDVMFTVGLVYDFSTQARYNFVRIPKVDSAQLN